MINELPRLTIPNEAGPVVQAFMRFFRLEHEKLWSVVSPLTPAQLDWRPASEADAIASIVNHVITAERLLLDLVAGLQPHGPTGDSPSYRVGRDGAGRPGTDAGAYLADLAPLYERGMAWLARLPDERLQESLRRPWDGREVTIEREIVHMLDHLAYHRGQIVYLTLLDGFPSAGSSSA